MNLLKYTFFSVSLLLLVGLFSCDKKKDDVEAETLKAKVIKAATTKTWTVNTQNTDVSGVSGSLDPSSFGIQFTETSNGLSFVLSGDLAPYLSGGTFDLNDSATPANIAVNQAEGLNASLATLTIDETKFFLDLTLESNRVSGIGMYKITFDAN